MLLLVPLSEGSRIAQLIETSNAEKPHDDVAYIQSAYMAVYTTPKGRSRCFVFDKLMNLRDSQIVKTKAQ